MIEVRQFRASEAAALMKFIGEHWQAGHVLSCHRQLLDWQHADGEQYAYLGAWDGDNLLAILGYIATRRYDPALAAQDANVTWLALWKLRADVKTAGLGLRLLAALPTVEASIAIGVLGINPDHLPMYRAMRYRTGELRQFAVFNPQAELRLAVWRAPQPRPVPRPGRAVFEELFADTCATIDRILHIGERARQLPRKSGIYFQQRYLRHPFYRYRVFAVKLDGIPCGLLAVRVAEHDGGRALRLVDWYGDAKVCMHIGTALEQLLRETHTEYADLWQYGIDPAHLASAGFEAVDADGACIVPTLFEPFVRANRRLQFAFRARDNQPFVLMRADGDQDRPNLLAMAGS